MYRVSNTKEYWESRLYILKIRREAMGEKYSKEIDRKIASAERALKRFEKSA